MADINDLSVTDASNTARFPEGMARATVNNSARALEGILARWHKDNNGSLATGGTSTAITVTLNQSSIAAWYDGLTFAARITTTCGATPTINPTGSGALGAKSLYWAGSGTQLASGDLTSTAVATFMYEATSDKVYVFAAPPAASATVPGVVELATDAETVTGTDTARATTPANITAAVIKQGKHTVWIPALAMVARTTNGAASGTVETATNKNMYKTLDFDTTTQEFAQFGIRMPSSWNEGTVTFIPVWSHPSTVTNFGVAFGLAGVAISNDDAGDVAFGTAQASVDTGGTTDDIYQGPESSAITIAGTPAAGDYVMFQINRTVADAGDTLGVDARLLGVALFITYDAAVDA